MPLKMNDTTSLCDPVEQSRAKRETKALALARVGVIVAFILLPVRPGLGHIGLALLVIGLVQLPSLDQRLRLVMTEPLARAAAALLIVLALATLWSSAPWQHRLIQLWHWRVLVLMIICLMIFDSRRWKLRLVTAATAAAVLVSTVGWVTWSLDWHIYAQHPAGTVLREGVTQGLFFAVCAYLSLLSAWRIEGLSRRQRRAFIVAAVLLIAAMFFVSAGRSAQAAFLIMALFTVAALLRGRARILMTLGLPILFTAAIFVAPMAKERFIRGVNEISAEARLDHPTSMGVRIELWRITAGLIADKPWFGYGTGAFESEYAKRAAATRTGWRAEPKDDTHNQYLSVQVQAGLIGSLAFAVFLLSVLRQSAPMPFRIGAMAIVCGWAAVSLFFSAFEDFNEGHMIAILLGCLMAKETDHIPNVERLRC
jgi:hypothetical protein